MNREVRYLSGAEIRAKADNTIEGYAAVFNQLSDDLGGFRERIRPGAFAGALRDSLGGTVCLFNHEISLVLGRIRAGTLTVIEDAVGLFYRCVLPATETGRSVHTAIDRGDIDQCSFSFSVGEGGQEWEESGGVVIRTLTNVDTLYDVSPVTFPAYSQTSVAARSLIFPEGEPSNLRAYLRSATKGIGYRWISRTAPAPAPYKPITVDGELEMLRARARIRLAQME
ncbi:MAG TPA: HK97 family phage prohead protease [Terriglobia bacterium]|nr:HK97 family phage prohead protease [Terriglobia bacterium]